MKKGKKVSLACQECLHKNYVLAKSSEARLELNKFCKYCNKSTLHKEEK
ncbi:50S ribosomal protein L33 [Mycoplasma struthionis]|uniref:Large ribosomal subunit protein bL33 n=1 Tax=Mycoplasma struthionis TaxID=538220 RepID=A0A3G8LG17_9MOLU|nr:50S ribosomal protein L33 [Mycoplasma struthionis]AZG68599.1 50S ribosomal protein L33 [Mycoplasma struthionis]TPI02335.1 50S ribosomal protein L33 [Mycoplasma struthionis]